MSESIYSLSLMTEYIHDIYIIYLFVSVDVTVYHRGYHGDLNETFFVGNVDEKAKNLVKVTYECLMQSIEAGK